MLAAQAARTSCGAASVFNGHSGLTCWQPETGTIADKRTAESIQRIVRPSKQRDTCTERQGAPLARISTRKRLNAQATPAVVQDRTPPYPPG